MSLLRTHDLVLQFGATTILDHLNLAINENAKIGLIGDNGTGKSTLLKVLAKKLPQTSGSVSLQPGIQLGYLAQEMEDPQDRTVYEEILTSFAEVKELEPKLREMEEQLSDPALSEEQRIKLANRYDEIQEEFRVLGGYETKERVEQVLSNLHLDPASWTQKVKTFSGGEKNLIGLAKILVRKPRIFLFDEPTNHLDAHGIDWFTQFLKNESLSFILVSHNRYLLDQCVTQIWELRKQKINIYKGNYSDYRRKKKEEQELQEKMYKNQQNTIERLQFQARRLKDMASAYDDPGQAKRAKAMERRIERMDLVEKPTSDRRRIGFKFNNHERHGLIALDIKDFSLQLGDRVLFDKAGFQLQYQERVCLVGPNGSGKTTLFRAILDKGSWENPNIRIGKSAKLGYYSQMHDTLNPEKSLVDNVRDNTSLTLSEAKTLLFKFLFTIEDLDRHVSTLSGGEKSRVQLACIMAQGVNLLLLDEPTNHLDISSCEIIEQVLEEFEGTLFIISHDRYFLDKMVERVVAIEALGTIKDYNMSFEEYWALLQKEEGKNQLTLPSRSKKKNNTNNSPLKELQKELRKLTNKGKQVEREIETLEAQKEDFSRQAEEAYSTQNLTEGSKFAGKLKPLEDKLLIKYAEWEELLERIEELESKITAQRS